MDEETEQYVDYNFVADARASLRHPHCNQEELSKVALDFASDMALKSNGSFIPYSGVEGYRQARKRAYAKVLAEAIEAAVRLAGSPPRRRAIKLRALKCMQPPYLTFDGEAKDPVESSCRSGLRPRTAQFSLEPSESFTAASALQT